MQLYESVQLDISSFTLGIDNLQLNVLMEVVNNILEATRSDINTSYLHKYFYLMDEEQQKNFKLREVKPPHPHI